MNPQVYFIVIENNKYSENSASTCINKLLELSPLLEVNLFSAVMPLTVDNTYKSLGLSWNPNGEGSKDLPKSALQSAHSDSISKSACTASHILLWHKAATENKDIIIMEHDAWPVNPIDQALIQDIQASKYKIVTFKNMDRKEWNYGIDKDYPSLSGSKCIVACAYYLKASTAKELMGKLRSIGHVPCNNDTFASEWFGFHPLGAVTTIRVDNTVPGIKRLSTSSGRYE